MNDHDLRADGLRRRVAQADEAGHADITVPTAEARSALLLLTCARGAVEHDYRVHHGVVRDLATARARMDRLATATERLLRNASEESVQAVREALADARRVDGRWEAPAEAVLDHLRRWAEDDPEVTTAGNEWLAGYVAAMKRVRELIGGVPAAAVPDVDSLKLDKPARIRHMTFGVGVKWRTVIEAAQRQHEYAAAQSQPTAAQDVTCGEYQELLADLDHSAAVGRVNCGQAAAAIRALLAASKEDVNNVLP